jgi:hypothetical protein
LLCVSSNVEYFKLREGIEYAADYAYSGCYKLKIAYVLGGANSLFYNNNNLETLVLENPQTRIKFYFFNRIIPSTLKNIVLKPNIKMNTQMFDGMTGVTIYVEEEERDVKWNENFPGWNNGNPVVYSDKWINAEFYAPDGKILSSKIYSTSQVIITPSKKLVLGNDENLMLVGWDLDADGVADKIPATSIVDIVATPVIHVHALDNCVVTKESTHIELGIKLYTCITCGYTKTEEIAKTPEHIFGAWTPDADGKNHIRTCICGETEKVAHTFDSGVITKPSTHTETGIKTYTCNECTYEKTEDIEKSPEKSDTSGENLYYVYALIGVTFVAICVIVVIFIRKKGYQSKTNHL